MTEMETLDYERVLAIISPQSVVPVSTVVHRVGATRSDISDLLVIQEQGESHEAFEVRRNLALKRYFKSSESKLGRPLHFDDRNDELDGLSSK